MNKFIFTLAGSGLLSLAVSPTLVFAQTEQVSDASSPIEILITAGRKQQAASDALAATSVVTREKLERSQSETLGEVLSQLPGISIGNTGGVGKQTSVYLRGSNSDHVLVLIDGVKMGSATLGSTPFEYLPLSQIERIEVVRGPRSSLYGSEAIGGVIQIFTRQGSKNGFTPRASVSYGSDNTRKADVNLSGGNGKTWYNFNVATERTDGFDSRALKYDFSSYQYIADTETDADGFTNNSASLRAGHDFGNGVTAEVSAMSSVGDNEYDGDFQNESEFKQQVLSAKISAPLGGNTKLTVQAGQALDEGDSFKDAVFAGSINTKRNTVSLQAESDLGNHNFVYGVDFQKDKVNSTQDYTVTSRDNTGLFGSYEASFGANTFAASLRQDDNEQFGDYTTGNIAFGHKLDNGIKLRASYGTAFKAPTFNDLYWPGSGNADLLPENSETFELGMSKKTGRTGWSVDVFNTEVEDLIEWAPDSTGNWIPQNVESATMKGIELGFATEVANWQVSANATIQQARQGNDKRLARRAERLFNLNIDRRFGAFTIGTTLHAEGDRFDDPANTRRLAGYTTVDLRGKYQLAKDWAVSAKVGNVFDKEYKTAADYNQDGINGLITLEYQPR